MTTKSNNQELHTLLFGDLHGNDRFGYGIKRLAVNIPGTIADKIPLRAYGYKDEKHKLYIGLRLYYDQGNYSKSILWDPSYTIKSHIARLVYYFEQEYGNKFN